MKIIVRQTDDDARDVLAAAVRDVLAADANAVRDVADRLIDEAQSAAALKIATRPDWPMAMVRHRRPGHRRIR